MLKKQNFAFDTDGLTEYVKQEQDFLIAKSVLQGKTIQHIQVLDGRKGTEKLALLDDTVTFQDGTACTISPSGDTVFTDKSLTVVDIAVVKSFCMKKLIKTFAEAKMVAGASAENQALPYEEQIVNHIVDKQAFELEKLIWVGDDSLMSGNLRFFNGFKTLLDADGSVIEANTTGVTAITVSNAYAVALSVARAIPEQVLDSGEATIFVGRATFDLIKDNLFTLNNYSVPVTNDHNDRMILPSTGVEVLCVSGLNGTSSLYAGRKSHFIFGTDLSTDVSSVEVWYSQDDDVVYLRNRFKAGVVYPFSSEMVKHTLALS
jgi:hypothetical protein